MAGWGQWLEHAGGRLAHFLTVPRPGKGAAPVSGLGSWLPYLQTGDVLLVEGSSRISTAIKYLTQSTWSHAALVLGPHPGPKDAVHLVEADVEDGVRCVPAAHYLGSNVRICRPWGLDATQRKAVADHALARLGHHYDLRNIVDLARYLLPLPRALPLAPTADHPWLRRPHASDLLHPYRRGLPVPGLPHFARAPRRRGPAPGRTASRPGAPPLPHHATGFRPIALLRGT